MANTYSLVTTNITDTAVNISVVSTTVPSTTAASLTVAVFKTGETGGITQSLSDPGTNSGQLVGTASFSSLTPSTQYTIELTGGPNVTTTVKNFATKIDRNTPRSATQEQWEDISSKVKAKADNSAFTGTDGVNAGTAGLVPAPATTDAGKFLKADGTWDTAGGGGPTVVQAIGNSTTDVMSQNAVSKAIFDTVDATRGYRPKIGHSTYTGGLQSVAFGDEAKALGSNATAIGGSTAANQNGAIALGYGATTSSIGEMNIGTSNTSYGYNSSNYRLITGVYDPVNAHDAATKGYVDGLITMTDTDPGEGSPLAANNFIGVYGGNPVILDYATSEINTGTKWINGDTIYKKTVSVGNLPNATMATTAHNISNFATLVKLEGSFTNGSNSAPIPYASPTTTKCVQAYADATNITIVTGEDRSAYSGYVTLYYTKSS